MSDTTELHQQTEHEPVTVEDLQKMLDDAKGRLTRAEQERDTERRRIAVIEAERDAERGARVATEQDRETIASRVVSESEQRWQAEFNGAKSGIEAQRGAIASAEDAYSRHAENGDWKAAAAAQRSMAEATARLTALEAKQEFLETNKERMVAPPPKPESRAPTQQRGQDDPISRYVSGEVLPAERDWLAQREARFTTDAMYRNEVFAASALAAARGYTRGSAPYFREMGTILGEDRATTTTDDPPRQQPARQTERQQSSDLAPQRRASPGQNIQGSRQFTLTADQREVADGLYGNPNSGDYIADEAERYQRYHANLEKRRAAGRM